MSVGFNKMAFPPTPAPASQAAAVPSGAGEARVGENAAGPFARPIVFDGCLGYLHPAGGEVGVLVCDAWGYEALCAHRAIAEFAEMLAGAGYPTLRFDYPGVANSRGDLVGRTLDDWIAAVFRAATALRRNSGVTRIVLAGFGLGCLIAVAAAKAGFECAGLLLLAPPLSGRRYIRETKAFAVMAAAPDDGGDRIEDGALSIAGFVMPPVLVSRVRALDPTRLTLPANAFALLATKPDADDGSLVAALGAGGARVEQIVFDGYAELLAGPTMAKTPTATLRRAVAQLVALCPGRGRREALQRQYPPASICDGDIVEEAARFGEGERLFGVVCRPRSMREGTPMAIMVNAGRNSHTGWRRMAVENARALARRGVASLRFDIGGMGESVAREGQPQEILYSDWPELDVVEAIDFVASLRYGPITLVGVCSGAYIAFQTAVADARVAGLVDINLYRMVWDPNDSVEMVLRYGNRPVTAAVARMFSRERLAKLLSGEIDVRRGVAHLIRRARRWVGVSTMASMGWLGPRGLLYAECMRRFAILRERGIETVLGYSAGDEGFAEIADYFGRNGRGLAAYPNVRVAIVEMSDHNLTPPHAGQWLIEQIASVVAHTMNSPKASSRAQSRR